MDSGVDRTISFGVTPSYRYEKINLSFLSEQLRKDCINEYAGGFGMSKGQLNGNLTAFCLNMEIDL